jgi:uncharacterized protein YdaU (DUF1376 family)
MSKDAWYAWYPGDYAADTRDLSCEEHGCYRLLLDASWSIGPLPDDPDRLRKIAGNCGKKVVVYVLQRFFQQNEKGWTNRRLEIEREKRRALSNKLSEAGKKGMGNRYGTNQVSNQVSSQVSSQVSNPVIARPQPQPQPQEEKKTIGHPGFVGSENECRSTELTKSNSKPPKPDKRVGFAEFWDAYPRKVSKKAAEKAWTKLAPDETLRWVIMGALVAAKKCDTWRNSNVEYIPHAATWLNGRRWEDEIRPAGQISSEVNYLEIANDWYDN